MNTSRAPQRQVSLPRAQVIRLRRWLWLGAFLLFAVGSALAETKSGAPEKPGVGGTRKEVVGCPSQDFATFFRAFSGRADLQRKYTVLPLQYGFVDMEAVETEFKTRPVRKFEDIPQYRAETGAIIPTAGKITADKLRFDIITKKSVSQHRNLDPEQIVTGSDSANAKLFLPGTEERLYYRFKRTAGCWFLFGISDRTT